MGRIVICGICGFQFEEGELQGEAKHVAFHEEQDKSKLELPGPVRDMIRYWAYKVLEVASLSVKGMPASMLQEANTAKWVLMHMWYNGGDYKTRDRDEAFKDYEAEVRKRYPNLRNLSSNLIGVGSHDTTERDVTEVC